mmetsp:Transcript_112602/g.223863  ORF Transcript_112602/g.223863 Transcript_112602/m.223863 type:complete len:241 (+) Transcript_112602:1342-2064(+)
MSPAHMNSSLPMPAPFASRSISTSSGNDRERNRLAKRHEQRPSEASVIVSTAAIKAETEQKTKASVSALLACGSIAFPRRKSASPAPVAVHTSRDQYKTSKKPASVEVRPASIAPTTTRTQIIAARAKTLFRGRQSEMRRRGLHSCLNTRGFFDAVAVAPSTAVASVGTFSAAATSVGALPCPGGWGASAMCSAIAGSAMTKSSSGVAPLEMPWPSLARRSALSRGLNRAKICASCLRKM